MPLDMTGKRQSVLFFPYFTAFCKSSNSDLITHRNGLRCSPMKMFNRHNEVWFVAEGTPVCPATAA